MVSILIVLFMSSLVCIIKLLADLRQSKKTNDQMKKTLEGLVRKLNTVEVYQDPSYRNKMGDMYL